MNSYVEREINFFLWVSVIAVYAFLFNQLANIFKLWAKARRIPGPPPFSFYGSSHLFSGSKLSDILSVSHKQYGPVVKLWPSPSQLLVSIMDPALIEEILLKAADKFPLTGSAFHLVFGSLSLFVSSVGKMGKQLNSLQKALSEKPPEGANELVKRVLDFVMEKKKNIMVKVGGLDCETVSQNLGFTIQGAKLFGDVFLTWSKAAIYEELFVKIAKDSCFWASYSVTPFWKPSFWQYQHLYTKLKTLTQELVEMCRENYKQESLTSQNSITSGQSHSSTTLMRKNCISLESYIYSEIDEAFGNLISIMFHGSLTVAGLVSSMLGRLAMYPEIQDKIYSEITTARKVSQSQGQQDTHQMPLLLATLHESARLLPLGPLLHRCSHKHDPNLKNGTTIPAGAILVLPLQLVQIDSSTWGHDASLFNPFRFLLRTDNGSDVHSPSFTEQLEDAEHKLDIPEDPSRNASFLPFGSVARASVGQKLVITEISTLFASLLEQYEVKLQPGSEGDPKPVMQNCIFNLLPSPKIIFSKRDVN